MAEKIKIKNFLTDVTGSMRVEKRREKAIENAPAENLYNDPIRKLAEELHPASTDVIVTKVEDVSPTARKIIFEKTDGTKFPPFLAGMYVSIEMTIGETKTCRPYSICSAPYQARLAEHPFIAVTVRNGRPGQGFAANYLYSNARPGDHFTVHVPYGFFYYEPLKDSKNIVALAGGSGITPFYSMAEEIAHGRQDSDLTILYGSVSHQDIILEKQLKAIESECSRVRFINVLSGDNAELLPGDEKGFIAADIIRKYMGEDPTFFVCGPLPMYNFVSGELKKLGIPQRRIHMEVFGAPRDITKADGWAITAGRRQQGDPYPYKGNADGTVQLTVVRGIHEDVIPAKKSEPIVVALERAAIPAGTRCRSGACGYCRAKLLSGDVFVPATGDGRRMADKENSYIHSCSTYPLTDVTVKIDIE